MQHEGAVGKTWEDFEVVEDENQEIEGQNQV